MLVIRGKGLSGEPNIKELINYQTPQIGITIKKNLTRYNFKMLFQPF